MSKLWMVRHAPTHAKVMVGWTDLPADLSDMEQIARVSKLLPDAPVISSDLTRAVATADDLQGKRQRLAHDARLREIHFGAWEMRSFDEINTHEPEALRAFWDLPVATRASDGESWEELRARVDAAVAALLAIHSELIVVAHFGAILTQIQRALHLSTPEIFAQKIDNLSVSAVDFETGQASWINHVP